MRKLSSLLVFAMFALVSTATFAQEEVKKETETVVKAVQDKVEVQLSELPEAVTKTLAESFADYTAEKAYKTTKEGKEVYIVKLSKEGEKIKVFVDTEGAVIEKKELNDSQSKLG